MVGQSKPTDKDPSPQKRALVEALLQQKRGKPAPASMQLVPRNPGESAPSTGPLSFAQERMWFLEQLEERIPVYNITLAQRLVGPLQVDALRESLNHLVRRHEALRTVFVSTGGLPAQQILPEQTLEIPVVDLSGMPEAERQREADRLASEQAGLPFDLEHGPLARASLVRMSADDHILLFAIHHLVSDEWSMEIIWREMSVVYNALVQEVIPELSALPVQYIDFATSQRNWLQGATLEGEISFWKEKLTGAPYAIELPTDHPRPERFIFHGATIFRMLPSTVWQGFKAIGQAEHVTPFTALLTAFQAWLARYTIQEDFLIGTPVANRTRTELEGVIGLFVNTLVLRCDLSGNPGYRQLLRRVNGTVLQALDHQNLPFDQLVNAIKPEREISRNPLVQVMFVLQQASGRELKLVGLDSEAMAIPNETAKFDLTLFVTPQKDGLKLRVEYSSDLYEESTIERWLDHFQIFLEGILADPDQPVYTLPLLTETERRQMLAEWNETTTDYPRLDSLGRLFEAQVRDSPEAVAVTFGKNRLTYQELNQRANQLAHFLQEQGIGPEMLVGIYMERSVEMLIATLGIVKAGGAYLPIDFGYPLERIGFMLADGQVHLLLTLASLVDRLPQHQARIVCLDRDWDEIATRSRENPPCDATAENLAYVIYTSGSTGQPKGVAIPQRAINRLVFNTNYIDLQPADRIAHISNPSFDAATFEIWGALLHGARLVVIDKDTILSTQELATLLGEEEISALFLTTALFNYIASEIPTAFANAKTVMVGGETLDPKWMRTVLESGPPVSLQNAYGPTECTTFATWYPVREVPENATNIPIGRPISNTTTFVLNRYLQPAPVGVPGELYLGGDGLARGYLNQPELTKDKFIPNPFAGNSRLYRTGDLVRWLPEGAIEFLGRIDGQVKLRGFRIELGEIESILGQHPGVRQSTVVVREDAVDQAGGGYAKRLVAYVVPSDTHGARTGKDITSAELRSFLKKRLPEYMLPSAFVFLEVLPITPNGKIDRRALPAPDVVEAESGTAHEAPANPLEIQLAGIWEELLGLKGIGRRDNFFDLGGHSLLAIRIFTQIKAQMGIGLPVSSLFQAPTIAELAELIRQGRRQARWEVIAPIKPAGSRPPLFLVHGFAGGVTGYAKLARLLDPDQSLFGLQARGIDGRQDPQTSIPAMAADYIKEMRTRRPQGPYHLGGYCFGGLIAYEMACQLRAQGEEVGLVAILEGYAPRSAVNGEGVSPAKKIRNFLQNLPAFLQEFSAMNKKEKISLIQIRFHLVKKIVQRKVGMHVEYQPEDFFGEDVTHAEPHLHKVMESHVQAITSYQPPIYSGKVTLFRVQRLSLFRSTDPLMGWGAYAAGGVEVHRIGGAHRNILDPPQVETLAREITACLDGYSHDTMLPA